MAFNMFGTLTDDQGDLRSGKDIVRNFIDPSKLGGIFGGGGGGGDSGGGGGGGQISPEALMWPGEAELRIQLLDYVKKYGDANENVKNLTKYEKRSLSELEKYLDAPGDELIGAGKKEILSTLGGGYDPASSKYYKPVIAGIEQRRKEAKSRNRRSYSLGGNLSSLARARAESESDISYEAKIAEMMMGLSERERARKLSVLPQAGELGQYLEESPLRKAQAAQTVGAIPRTLETRALGMGQNLLTGYNPTYYYPLYSANYGRNRGGAESRSGSKWGGAASGALSGAKAGSAFGPYGTAIGGVAGGLLGYFGN